MHMYFQFKKQRLQNATITCKVYFVILLLSVLQRYHCNLLIY